jgi:murein DD-endopeptidase MepM/ murein hydrolase activator NlpD
MVSFTFAQTPVATVPPTNTKRATALPTNTRRPTITATSSPLPTIAIPTRATFVASPIPGAFGGNEFATWTPLPDQSTSYTETFVFARPIPGDAANYPARNYLYGSRDGGGRPTHHGLDFQNPAGTPVLAVYEGEIIYAGPDIQELFGPQPNFYGNVIVIKHPLTDVDGRPIYSLYGHLSKIYIPAGVYINGSEVIGLVGSTGVAVGAHLHLEVRVGNPNDYTATRNPELWIKPYTGNGAIVGQVRDAQTRQLLPGILISIRGVTNRETESYWDEGTPGDTRLKENFIFGDVPAGYYQVIIRTLEGALKYRNTVYVRPGRVTQMEIYITP